MANTAQARKRARQNEVSRLLNRSQRSALRTTVKKVVVAIEAGDAGVAAGLYAEAVPSLDRMAARGLIHPNKAARHKSRLNRRIRAVATPTA